jgi:hypothetical protein
MGLIGFAALTATQGGADAPELKGVERAALEKQEIYLRQPSGRTPRVAQAQAVRDTPFSSAPVIDVVLLV